MQAKDCQCGDRLRLTDGTEVDVLSVAGATVWVVYADGTEATLSAAKLRSARRVG